MGITAESKIITILGNSANNESKLLILTKMTRNRELMRDAKAILKGKWGLSALTSFIMTLLFGLTALLGGPLSLGYILYLKTVRDDKQNARPEILFDGFHDFGRAFVAYFFIGLFVFLWMLLFIIPGIVMSIAYSMTMFILADNPDISAMDAIRKSRDMMTGYKWKFFCLQLRFIGWGILCVFTVGIGGFWLEPYIRTSYLQFYEDVKADYESRT